MALSCSAQQWASWNWTTAEAGSPGLRLTEAFTAFADAVNANPGNNCPLSIVKDHTSATGTTNFGYVWRLGHPVNPVLMSFYNTSKVQGFSASASSAVLRLGLETAYTNDTSNGGYGTFAATISAPNAGLSHYAPDGSPAVDLGAFLLVQMDTAPGSEFFCYTIAPVGADTYTQNHTMVLFRSAASSGWNIYFSRSNAYVGMIYSVNAYIWNNDVIVPAGLTPVPNQFSQQSLINPVGLYVAAATGLFSPGAVTPRLLLPGCLWFGSNEQTDPRRLGRCGRPGGGGTFYQLGAASSGATDLWYLHPTSTPAALAGWAIVGSLPWTSVTDRLSFCPLAPVQPLATGPSTVPDFVWDWPMAVTGLPGAQQHPFYATQLQGAGGGGRRPATGVLWPRGNG